jgi:hypothetical protein
VGEARGDVERLPEPEVEGPIVLVAADLVVELEGLAVLLLEWEGEGTSVSVRVGVGLGDSDKVSVGLRVGEGVVEREGQPLELAVRLRGVGEPQLLGKKEAEIASVKVRESVALGLLEAMSVKLRVGVLGSVADMAFEKVRVPVGATVVLGVLEEAPNREAPWDALTESVWEVLEVALQEPHFVRMLIAAYFTAQA